jgi:hypothetical protein
LRSVKQIDRNVLVPPFDIRFATADRDHVPVVQSKKVAQKVSAHDSGRAGDQRLLAVRHGWAPSVLGDEARLVSKFEWHRRHALEDRISTKPTTVELMPRY